MPFLSPQRDHLPQIVVDTAALEHINSYYGENGDAFKPAVVTLN